MSQHLTIVSILFIWLVTVVPCCTPPPPVHQTKDKYSTGISEENEGGLENERVRFGMPDAFGEVEEEEEEAVEEDAGSTDTNCTPFHPDYPNC